MNVEEYIANQPSPQKEICLKLRQILHKSFPQIKEELKWGVPTYDDGKYYFVALKKHVNLGFLIQGLSKEEIALLEGTGKTMRHLKIRTIEEIDEAYILNLLRMIKDE